MWNELLVAVALVLVLEGIFPFLAPDKFKQALAQLDQMSGQALRIAGLASITLGVILLYILRLAG